MREQEELRELEGDNMGRLNMEWKREKEEGIRKRKYEEEER